MKNSSAESACSVLSLGQTEKRLAALGRDYWYHYVSLNGYAKEPNEAGLDKLSRNLDLTKSYLRRCIYLFLNA